MARSKPYEERALKTIGVSASTYERLEILKSLLGLRSFNDVVKMLLEVGEPILREKGLERLRVLESKTQS